MSGAVEMCDQCGSAKWVWFCPACHTWQCSNRCRDDHDRREHQAVLSTGLGRSDPSGDAVDEKLEQL